MPTVEESITISRSVEDIWSYLIDTANVPVYESQVTRIDQLTDGDVELGTQWEGTTKVLGRSLDWKSQCVTFEPTSTYSLKTTEAKLAFQITWKLASEGPATRVTYHLEAESGLGGVFGKLGDPIVVRAQARTVKTNLANLKELLEAED